MIGRVVSVGQSLGIIRTDDGREFQFTSGECVRNGTHYGALAGTDVHFGAVDSHAAWVSSTPVDQRSSDAMEASFRRERERVLGPGWPEMKRRLLGDARPKPEHPIVPRETRHMFRPQRSTLADAMAEAKEFDGTWDGLQALQYRGDVLVAVEEYGGIDDRIGWDTYIVTVTNPAYGDASTRVAGFTNGPVPRETLRNDTPQ